MTQSLAILYGSSTGNTEMAAEMIRERLGSAVTHFADIADTEPEVLLAHDILILGVATWNNGTSETSRMTGTSSCHACERWT